MSRVPRAIVHLIATNFFGGPERQILAHVRGLAGLGLRPVVASFLENRERVEIVDRAQDAGLETFLVTTRSSFSVAAISQVAAELRARHAAILVTHGYKSDVVGHAASRLCGIPHVSCARGFTGEDPKVRVYEWIGRRFMERADRVVAVSFALARLVESQGIAAERVRVIHNAVHLPPAPAARPPAPLAASTGPRICAVGRLSPEKGHRVLVEALAAVIRREPRAHAAIYGEGPERAALLEQIEAAGLGPRVRLAGFVPSVPEVLVDFDLLVNPSFTEGLPNAILEAFHVGVPVVATAVGGVPEIVIDGETGWLVPAGDAERMASCILTALADAPGREHRAARAKELLRERFSAEIQLEKWLAVYRELDAVALEPAYDDAGSAR